MPPSSAFYLILFLIKASLIIVCVRAFVLTHVLML